MTIHSPAKIQPVFNHNALVPELSRELYIKRREWIQKQLDAPLVISGLQSGITGGEVWPSIDLAYWQEPSFLYYSGLWQRNCYLVLFPWKQRSKDSLFLPEKNEKQAFWEGFHFGFGSTQDHTTLSAYSGIKNILPRSSFSSFLQENLLKKYNGLYSFRHESIPKKQDSLGRFFASLERMAKKENCTIKNAIHLHWQQRLVLDEVELKQLKKAIQYTANAFSSFYDRRNQFKTEHEARAYLEMELTQQHSHGLAFSSIVAGGENAAVLHYTTAQARLKKNSLLLLDFGTRSFAMNSDISRTIPLADNFNPMQSILYNIVLDVQISTEKHIQAGTSFDDLNDFAWSKMNKLVKERFTDKGGKWQKSYEDRPHNIGHYLGFQVHEGDPSRNYRNQPIVDGSVITNEPGLYGHFSIKLNGKSYSETLGIRIEDDLHIKNGKVVNLSKKIRK